MPADGGAVAAGPARPARERELAELVAWLGDQPRDERQTHGLGESDAEVVRVGDHGYLAVSTDAVAEELAEGLYRDPHTIGWVAAVNGLSDIAAVGAEPLGVLLTAIWPADWPAERRALVARGLADALSSCGTALLGGDTAVAGAPVLSVTAVGWSQEPPMSRLGAAPGDVLAVTGPVGAGAALAARTLLGEDADAFPESLFRPRARLREGTLLRPLASACTDASDGLLQAVETLATLNGLGASLRWDPATLDPRATAYFEARGLPLWPAWVSELSEFELVVAVPEESWDAAVAAVPSLRRIGCLSEGPDTTVAVGERTVALDLARLPSAAHAPAEARLELMASYLAEIRELGLP